MARVKASIWRFQSSTCIRPSRTRPLYTPSLTPSPAVGACLWQALVQLYGTAMTVREVDLVVLPHARPTNTLCQNTAPSSGLDSRCMGAPDQGMLTRG